MRDPEFVVKATTELDDGGTGFDNGTKGVDCLLQTGTCTKHLIDQVSFS
jgi:hypothetical protein